jgi:adhesin/invasin
VSIVTAARGLVALAALLVTIAVVSSGGLVTPARAATTWHVTNCNDTGSGSLRDMVTTQAADGDTIVFDQDCTGANQIVLSSGILISPNITIDGTGHDIVLSGNDAVRILAAAPSSTVTLSHLTLTHGKSATASGGAIVVNSGAALTVQDCTFSDNSAPAAAGGAIWVFGSTLNIQNSTFDGNTAIGGGAVGVFSFGGQGSATIQGSTFQDNQSTGGASVDNSGGAIVTLSAPVTIDTSTFTGNQATGAGNGGGAISGSGGASGAITVDRSTFTANTGAKGGAFQNLNALTVRNSTLTGNGAGAGGGIYTTSAFTGGAHTVTLQNDTISDNTISTTGGGIYNDPASPATVTIANSIVSDLSGSACGGDPVTDGGYNLQANETSCGFADHNVSSDPLLGSLANNGGPTQTRALGAGSPAIGAGSGTVCQSAGIGNRDQRGHKRYADLRGSCDIGAYDTGAGPPSAATTLIDRSPKAIAADGSSTATITVRARDASGVRLRTGGATVTLQSTLGGLSAVTDNGDGTYTATLTAGTVSGTATVTGSINSTPISAQAAVLFQAGPPSGSTTTIKAAKSRIPADGSSTSIITVQAKDQYGNLIKAGGATVVLNTSAGSLGSVSFIGSGRYQATLTSATSPGTATISGTINGNPITAPATVLLTNPPVTTCNDSGPGSLRAVVAGAPSGATIVFAQNCTISLSANIYVTGTTLTIDGTGHAVTIDGGHATRLVNLDSTATVTFARLTFANGSAGGSVGGGINNNGTVTVRDSTFTGNSADQGGGIQNAGTATVQNSTFSGNNASYGGGIKNIATLTIDNSTFVGNDGGVASGALDNQATGTITVRNSTFAGNTSGLGGLIYNQGPASFANSIVSGTGQCQGPTPVTNGGNNLQFGDTSCGFSITADPLLGSLASNGGPTQTMALSEGSPAIGAGNATVCQAAGIDNLDQRGLSRRADTRGRCDIGAYDTRGLVAGSLSPAKTKITRDPTSIPAGGASTSTITVRARDANGIPFATGGATVTLDTSAGSLSSVTDNGDGTYTATLTSAASPGIAHISGTINGQPIGLTTTVSFT